ncbi:MAG TPA: rhomboid family intramembrane serine protease [Pseudonocardiaceae bacterium]|nr:rhomboid family intramembrane serine protease [Pseudonocardiaceae bacterium]
MTPAAAAGKTQNPAKRILPPRPLRAAVVITSFTAVLYLVELVNAGFYHGSLDNDGIHPRSVAGLIGIVFAPLLHVSWAHLLGNTIPVLVFGFLAMAGGIGPWIATTAFIWVISGLGVWLISPGGGSTVGASGLAFGWLMFLLVRGIFNRVVGQILVALVLLFYWGSVLWGLVPGRADISWQGHLFGALAGVLCAFLVAKANRQPAKVTPSLPGPTLTM